MYVQFSQGLPGLVLDERKNTIHIETSKAAANVEKVYERYLDGDTEFFKISEDHARGFYEFLSQIEGRTKEISFVKGQVTGPVSFALSVTDQNKRSIIYEKDILEVATKVLSMKARWQIREIRKIFPNVIIFVDEPYLVSIGSSFVNINVEDAVKRIDEVIDLIKSEGAYAGIHCCGNTDWSILLKRDIDILSFDTYNFSKEFSLYSDGVKSFLTRGGGIAWGIVPSSQDIDGESKGNLSQRLKAALGLFREKGITESMPSLVTPSCGVSTLDEDRAKKIMEMTRV